MPEQKIAGKSYLLQRFKWIQACRRLTKSQLSLLYFLRCVVLCSNGTRVRASEIEELLVTGEEVENG